MSTQYKYIGMNRTILDKLWVGSVSQPTVLKRGANLASTILVCSDAQQFWGHTKEDVYMVQVCRCEQNNFR
jgi:hypothetical protein